MSTSSNKYKVNGPATFKGNSAIELQIDTTALAQGISVVNTAKTYTQLTGSTYSTYGVVNLMKVPVIGDYTMTASFTPAVQYPLNLALNIPYTQTYTIHTESSSALMPAAPDITQTSTHTFLAVETITVAAGTFSSCKIKNEDTANGKTGSAFIWIVANGRYQGLTLKADDQNGNIVETTKLLFNGS